ncbi:MAG: VPLPA-CTERM sorting domain-containing protein [Gemmobacter sp.]
MTTIRTLAAAAATALALTGAAGAATVSEADLGDFSNDWRAFTAIGGGPTTIRGTGKQGDADHVVLTGLKPGAQTLTFTFSGPVGAGNSYSAGGNLLYGFEPYKWSAWDGKSAGSFNLRHGKLTDTLTLSLDAAFSGPLYLTLHHTHGALDWSLEVPGNAAASVVSPSAVPLPAGVVLLLGALGGLAAFRRRAA